MIGLLEKVCIGDEGLTFAKYLHKTSTISWSHLWKLGDILLGMFKTALSEAEHCATESTLEMRPCISCNITKHCLPC